MSLRFDPLPIDEPPWDFLGLDESSSLSVGLAAVVDYNLGRQDLYDQARTFNEAGGIKGSNAGFGASVAASGTMITRSSGISVAASSDYTFLAQVANIGWAGTNPGCWRNTNEFNIFNSTTGRPWIRIGGFDDLKPVSGWQEVAGSTVTFAFRARSAKDLAYASNGQIRHTASTIRNVGACTVTDFGYQNISSESVTGTWTFLAFWKRGLTDEELESVTAAPRQMLRRVSRHIFFSGAAPSFKPYWALQRSRLLGAGYLH